MFYFERGQVCSIGQGHTSILKVIFHGYVGTVILSFMDEFWNTLANLIPLNWNPKNKDVWITKLNLLHKFLFFLF